MKIQKFVDEVNVLKNQIAGCDNLINLYQDKKKELTKCLEQLLNLEVVEHSTIPERTYFDAEIWDIELRKMLKKTIFWQCTNKKFRGDIKYQGDYVMLPKGNKLCVDQKKFFVFKVDDAVNIQRNLGLVQAHLINSKKNIENVVNQCLLSLFKDIKNVIGSVDSPIKLDKFNIYKEFSKIAVKLKDSFDSENGFWIIVSPYIKSIVVNSPEFIEASKITDTMLREDAIGRLAGMDVLVSEELYSIDGKYNVIAGADEAITFTGIIARIENLRDRDSFSDLIRGLYLYGLKIVEQKAILRIVVKAEG